MKYKKTKQEEPKIRVKIVSTRVSIPEFAEIIVKADKEGVTVSEYLHSILFPETYTNASI